MAQWNYDPIVIKKRAGTIDDPYVEYDNISYLIQNKKVFLDELPDIGARVRIENLYETLSETPEPGKFFVNYNQGYIVFNENINNTTVLVTYSGTGIIFVPVSRVCTAQENGNVTETLDQFVENIKYMTQDQLDQLTGKVSKTGDTMSGQLNFSGANGILLGDKYRLRYNGAKNSLDISYLGN